MSKTFVLIHGSWHGGWAWQDVIHHLSERGHRAHAPTLPGHGPAVTRLGVTHQDCVASVVAYIQRRGLEDVILVGHSFGGTVVQKVAEQLPDRIGRTIFLDAISRKHICLPFESEEHYGKCVADHRQFREYLNGQITARPELFPEAVSVGYAFHDKYQSRKLKLTLRRIKLKQSREVFTIRPSFVRPTV